MSDLRAELERALEPFRDELVSAWLFGSRAMGRAHEESDVDVAVLFHAGAHPDARARARRTLVLASDLIAATHVNRVDVVALNDAPAELAANVLVQGLRLACSDPEADHEFTRRTLLLAADQQPFLRRMRRIKLAALRR